MHPGGKRARDTYTPGAVRIHETGWPTGEREREVISANRFARARDRPRTRGEDARRAFDGNSKNEEDTSPVPCLSFSLLFSSLFRLSIANRRVNRGEKILGACNKNERRPHVVRRLELSAERRNPCRVALPRGELRRRGRPCADTKRTKKERGRTNGENKRVGVLRRRRKNVKTSEARRKKGRHRKARMENKVTQRVSQETF